jgi:DNA-binding transcriptional LysR family regulator
MRAIDRKTRSTRDRAAMDDAQLATFLDLVTTGSFHRTAERLGVTQSTVSARIRALEAATGAVLFTRGRAGARLTTEGLRFAPHARALLRGWEEARRAAQGAGPVALTVRVGIQHDLAGARLGDWLAAFRRALPDAGFYIELDYSAQMCADVAGGRLDFAVLFTPHPDPDLHTETVGELRYRMISTDTDRLASVDPARYIMGNYAPAFAAAHRAALPALAEATLASGQNAAVAGLLAALGGTAYVTEETAEALAAAGTARAVADAPVLTQPVHAAMPLRLRTARLQARLLGIVRRQFASRRPPAGASGER